MNFHHVGQVNAIGTSVSPSYYSLMDTRMSGTRICYRIKSVDRDGAEILSQMVEVTDNGEANIILFPNPFQENHQVRWTGAEMTGESKDEILDINGAL